MIIKIFVISLLLLIVEAFQSQQFYFPFKLNEKFRICYSVEYSTVYRLG